MTTVSHKTQGAERPQAPEGFSAITPHLVVPNVDEAVAFYKKVFGAQEIQRSHGPDNKVWHCQVRVYGSRLLLMEDFPTMRLVAPATSGDQPASVIIHLFVADVDGTYARAMAAGAKEIIAPHDSFWGDRYAELKDPSGHRWSLGNRRENLSPDEQSHRAEGWRLAHGGIDTPVPALQSQGVLRVNPK
ncbi:MAG: VOC family protein [Pseudonocardiaceae bacterium]